MRRKKKSRPLKFGSIVHEMIEANINGQNPFALLDKVAVSEEKLFRAEVEMYGEIIEDIRCIMTEYFDHYADDGITYAKRGGKRAEHQFDLPLTSNISINGKIDAFAKTSNGLRWLTEHKTFNYLPNEDDRWRNVQSAIYTRVNDMLEWPEIDGTMWDYIWSKPPGRPQMKKDGELSLRHIVSLPLRIRETLKDHRLKESKYKGLIEAAKKNRSQYFQRIFNPVKKKTVDLVWRDFVYTAKEMAQRHGDVRDRNIDRHCSYCDYEAICRAELTGGDVGFVIEREYEKSKHEKTRR